MLELKHRLKRTAQRRKVNFNRTMLELKRIRRGAIVVFAFIF